MTADDVSLIKEAFVAAETCAHPGQTRLLLLAGVVDMHRDGFEWPVRFRSLALHPMLWGALWLASPICYSQTAPVTAAGATAGTLSVASSGASTYTIPLQVPPGTAGVEPKLTLSYNSQAGNGLLGVGWSLTGLSTISRCAATISQDGIAVNGSVNFDANDRFCMDGQRLMVVNGTYGSSGAEYRTERDSFSKVVSNGSAGTAPVNSNPAYFIVKSKSGLTMEYGNTTDSRIEAQGRTDGAVRTWALDRVSDTSGNYMTITYTEDTTNGQYYPVRMDYTGNGGTAPNASVQFVYESRPDIIPFYLAGSLIQDTVRLKTIQTYTGTREVKEYRNNYGSGSTTGRSVLASIQECAMSPSVACKAATTFNVPTASTVGLTSPANGSVGTYCTCILEFVMDVNGDGKSDLVRLWQNGSRTYAAVWLSNGSSFTQVSNADIGPWSTSFQYYVMDVNGDGKSDLVRLWQNGSRSYAAVWQSTGTGFTVVSNGDVGSWSTTFQYFVMDVNGDGRSDLVRLWQNGSLEYADVWASNGSGFTNISNGSLSTWCTCIQDIVMDINGDGKSDWVRLWQNGSRTYALVLLSNGTGFTQVSNADIGSWSTGFQYFVMDINGDGRSDLVRLYQNGTLAYADVWLSTGKGFTEISNASVSTWCTCIQEFDTMDINGDGRNDLVRLWQNGSRTYADVWLSTGRGFKEASNADIGPWSSAFHYFVMDVNGDGKSDLVRMWQNGTLEYAAVWSGTADPTSPDTISSIVDGLGATASVAYLPSTNASVYSKGTGAAYPVVDVQVPIYVASSVHSTNGIGGTLTSNYQYGVLQSDFSGRSLLGFSWMKETSADTNIAVLTNYRQDWPYLGMPSQIQTTLPGSGSGGTLKLVSNSFGCINPVNGGACALSAGSRYFPYVSQTVESTWDLNGAALPVVTIQNGFDNYGNATQVSVGTSDSYCKVTRNVYIAADTTNWILGRVARSTLTSKTPPDGSTCP